MPADRPSRVRSLQLRLPLAIAVLVLLVVALVASVAYREVRASALESTQERLDQVGAQLAALLGQSLETILGDTRAVAEDPEFRAGVAARIASVREAQARPEARVTLEVDPSVREAVRELARSNVLVGAVTLWSPEGALLIEEAGPAEGPGLYDAGLGFPGWLEGDDAGIAGFRGDEESAWYDVAATVRAPSGDETIAWLVQHRRTTTTAQTVEVIRELIGMEGRFLVGVPGGSWTDLVGIVPGPAVDAADPTRLVAFTSGEEESLIGRVVRIEGSPWHVWVAFPMEAIMARPRAFLARIVRLGAAIVLLGGLGGWAVSRRVTGRLVGVTTAAGRLAQGEYDTRADVRGEDEIGQLGRAFDRMADSLQSARSALERSEAGLRELFDRNPLPLLVHDSEEGRILEVNEAAIRRYGYDRDEFTDLALRDLIASDPGSGDEESGGASPSAAPPAGPGPPGETLHRTRDGAVIQVESTSHPLEYLGRSAVLTAVVDITERKRLEAEVRQAQKLESVGRLAGGIAHDFNNLLTAVRGYAEFLRTDERLPEALAPDVEGILEAAERASSLTRQLLAFGRRQVLDLKPLDLNEVVGRVTGLLGRLLGADIEVRTETAPELGTVRADAGQMEQVLLNLAVNARDAMPGGGTLTIRTANIVCSLTDADPGGTPAEDRRADDLHRSVPGADGEHELEPGGSPYVLLEVRDTGTGMDEVTVGRLFEPFFTTKPPGEGSGLGLPMVYGIVRQSGGHVRVSSRPGEGASFRIYLPRIDGTDAGREEA